MFEYRFEDRAALQFLALIPLMALLMWWMFRRTRQVVNSQISPKISAFLLRSVSTRKRKWKLVLQCLALALFVVALARPQSGESKQKAKSEGLEIMIALDVSNSMLTEDARPSRLELAKLELSRFLDSLSGDKVGLVAFAGSAVTLSPMTTDKAAMKMFIDSLNTHAVTTQGTDFRKALNECYTALQRGGVDAEENKNTTKVIIVVSDGEDNEKGAIDQAEKIAADGIRIFTLGIGTEQGGQIPMRDVHGNLLGYKKDKSGQAVISKTSDDSLKALATAGKGTYQHITFGGDAIRNLKASIDQLQRTQMDTAEVTNYNEHYQAFLFLGILLALIELLLSERKAEGRIWKGRFEIPAP